MVGLIVGIIGVAFGLYCGWKLRQWEHHLARSRIAIAYKGKVKMNTPLYEWLLWANRLDKDQQSRGRAVYKMGSTTVAILKPQPRTHGKTKTKTVKEAA
jgi:hypothetical protein